jgi:ApaG protein
MASESEAVTHDIRVRVQSQFVPEQSNPEDGLWFFAYRVTLENLGTETVQLVSRHWIITDGNGHVEHVRGPGVVGEQPTLGPGDDFVYTSACPLPTPFGTMHGSYQMIRDPKGARDPFSIDIAAFTLAEPGLLQ